MIEPIRPGHELFPYDIEIMDGKEKVRWKKDWNDHKQVAQNIHSIEYLLQFEEDRGSTGLINMIEAYAFHAEQVGEEQQKKRFREFMDLRAEWLNRPNA